MIKVKDFYLEKFDKIDHFVFMKKLARDESVIQFVHHDLEKWLENMPNSSDEFMADCPYVIVRDNKNIGMLGTKLLDNDIVEFWYALDKDERGKKLGWHILCEMTAYLIDKFPDIRLVVKKDNQRSINIAVDNAYVLDKEESTDDKNVYYYFGRKSK